METKGYDKGICVMLDSMYRPVNMQIDDGGAEMFRLFVQDNVQEFSVGSTVPDY